jgi:hypothetical protein
MANAACFAVFVIGFTVLGLKPTQYSASRRRSKLIQVYGGKYILKAAEGEPEDLG